MKRTIKTRETSKSMEIVLLSCACKERRVENGEKVMIDGMKNIERVNGMNEMRGKDLLADGEMTLVTHRRTHWHVK